MIATRSLLTAAPHEISLTSQHVGYFQTHTRIHTHNHSLQSLYLCCYFFCFLPLALSLSRAHFHLLFVWDFHCVRVWSIASRRLSRNVLSQWTSISHTIRYCTDGLTTLTAKRARISDWRLYFFFWKYASEAKVHATIISCDTHCKMRFVFVIER